MNKPYLIAVGIIALVLVCCGLRLQAKSNDEQRPTDPMTAVRMCRSHLEDQVLPAIPRFPGGEWADTSGSQPKIKGVVEFYNNSSGTDVTRAYTCSLTHDTLGDFRVADITIDH